MPNTLELNKFIADHKLPAFRKNQLEQAIYRDYLDDWNKLTTWSLTLREALTSNIQISTLELVTEQVSADKHTRKALFNVVRDGQKIETVLMQHRDGRNTVCVSCMVGCPVNCSFCATGKMGFGGNLTADEIIDQVLFFSRFLAPSGQRVSNIVFMGMGEPMLNLRNVQQAINVFTKEMGISGRKITISTSGYVPQLRELMNSGFRGRLAVSLHAPNQELRERLMPVAKLYPFDKLLPVLFEFEQLTNKRISYEYIMIDGITDTEDCARELGRMFHGHLAHINLIPYNPVRGEDFKRSDRDQIRKFSRILEEYKLENTVRVTMGDDIDAACGQLVDRYNQKHIAKKLS